MERGKRRGSSSSGTDQLVEAAVFKTDYCMTLVEISADTTGLMWHDVVHGSIISTNKGGGGCMPMPFLTTIELRYHSSTGGQSANYRICHMPRAISLQIRCLEV